MLKEKRIVSNHDQNIQSEYVMRNVFENTTESIIYKYFVDFLNKGYEPEDIFIFAPSLKHKYQLFENYKN